MQRIDSKHAGPLAVAKDTALHGMVTGQVSVLAGATFDVHGMVCDDISVQPGGTLLLSGMATGDVINNGGSVVVDGMVVGEVRTLSGDTRISPGAVVNGRTH